MSDIFSSLAVSANAVSSLKTAYLASLPIPIDGMWEAAFIDVADHFELRLANQQVGYFTMGENKCLRQFYVAPEHYSEAGEIFAHILNQHKITYATVSTGEPHYLSLCLENQKTVAVNSLLFHAIPDNGVSPGNLPQSLFQLAQYADLHRAVDFCAENMGGSPTWLNGYLTNLIRRKELYLLTGSDEILGTGECRVSDTQLPFADLGMIVSKAHRRKGIGSGILQRLRNICDNNGLKAICSCEASNLASRKAIEKAGFVSEYRILDVGF